MGNTRGFEANTEDKAFLKALKEQMPPDMPAQRILAIVSQFVGQLIALQDKRVMTPDQAMRVVGENIEIGNRAALLTLTDPDGEA
jgi:hypothetical protein